MTWSQRRALRWIEAYQRAFAGRPSPCRFYPDVLQLRPRGIRGAWHGPWRLADRSPGCCVVDPSGRVASIPSLIPHRTFTTSPRVILGDHAAPTERSTESMFEIPAALLSWFYGLTNSYTIAIAMIAAVVMAITTPLTLKSTKGMLEMQKLAPEMRKLQNEYRNDRTKLNEEMMKLYQEHKVNPMASCLPLLAQAPVFYIMFRVLRGMAYRPDRRRSPGLRRGVDGVRTSRRGGRPGVHPPVSGDRLRAVPVAVRRAVDHVARPRPVEVGRRGRRRRVRERDLVRPAGRAARRRCTSCSSAWSPLGPRSARRCRQVSRS